MGRSRKFFEEYEVQNVPKSILPVIKSICEKYGKLDEKQKAKTIQRISGLLSDLRIKTKY